MGSSRVKVGSYFRRFALKISTLGINPCPRQKCTRKAAYSKALFAPTA